MKSQGQSWALCKNRLGICSSPSNFSCGPFTIGNVLSDLKVAFPTDKATQRAGGFCLKWVLPARRCPALDPKGLARVAPEALAELEAFSGSN